MTTTGPGTVIGFADEGARGRRDLCPVVGTVIDEHREWTKSLLEDVLALSGIGARDRREPDRAGEFRPFELLERREGKRSNEHCRQPPPGPGMPASRRRALSRDHPVTDVTSSRMRPIARLSAALNALACLVVTSVRDIIDNPL